jgi:hypothetical protein
MPIRRRGIAVALLTLLIAPAAFAQVQLGVDVGWSNRFRGGRWTPLYITLSSPQPRQVNVDVYSPTDRRYAMRIYQSVAIGPAPATFAIYIPMSYRVDEASVTVRDGDSNKRLADYILADSPAFPGQTFRGTPEMVSDSTLFAGVSGNPVGEHAAESQLDHIGIKPGVLAQARLPAVAAAYDALDLLVLNQPELAANRISPDQQRAIADWVRAGGKLLIWPGAEPMPAEGPLAEILPATVGASQAYAIDPAALASAGLPGRFAKLKGRLLSNPVADAKPIRVLGASDPFGYRRWVGYGQVVMLGFDPTQFTFNELDQQRAFWRSLLAGVMQIPDPDPSQQNNWQSETARTVPLQKTMNWLGNIPGAGSFGFGYVATTLLALMFVVGPVDWFVLKWTGRQPWTWVTISGWIALVTLGAIYVGHVFKSGELHFRTATLIDEAGGVRVASQDLVGIYSPRTQDYKLDVDPYGWWRPGGDGEFFGGGGLELEIPCHQDYRGNTPKAMTIGVWNLRFLENQQFGPSSPPIVDAKLKADAKHVTGKIVNRGTVPMSELAIRTQKGVAHIHETIAPGASLAIDAAINDRDKSLSTMPVAEQRRRFQRYDPDEEGPATRPSQALLAGIGDTRAEQIEQILHERADVACVYANYDADPSERVKLDESDEAHRAHIGLVRALVPLE